MTHAASRAALLPLSVALLLGCTASRVPDFASLVEQVAPSVVNVSTVPVQAEASSEAPLPDGAPFGEWFRRFLDEQEQAPPPDTPQTQGSGVILWDDGHVLTNYHVVADAGEILVRLWDRREYPATLVGVDEPTDLALLKIEAEDLPAARIGSSENLRVGEWVLAIGSPFGFEHSATAGIVSAKGRGLYTEQYVPYIQTDVAINPGNSGGPLFNLDGEVVGINSQIYSQTGTYMGVSFAIPVDVAMKVARQLRDQGRVTRGWLGVVVQEVDRRLAQSFGLDRAQGALVAQVVPDSPAAIAGLRAGDVILAYDGRELPSSRALPPLVGLTEPGRTVPLEVLRDGRRVRIDVQIGVLPEDGGAPREDGRAGRTPADAMLGLAVRPLSAAERREEKIESGGLRVLRVGPGAGQRAGLRPGDILLSIAGTPVDSEQRLREVVQSLTPGATVPMLVQRRGAPLFLALEVPERR